MVPPSCSRGQRWEGVLKGSGRGSFDSTLCEQRTCPAARYVCRLRSGNSAVTTAWRQPEGSHTYRPADEAQATRFDAMQALLLQGSAATHLN